MNGPISALIAIMGNRLLFNLRAQDSRSYEENTTAGGQQTEGVLTTLQFRDAETSEAMTSELGGEGSGHISETGDVGDGTERV